MLFQTCMIDFLLLNTKEDILKNVSTVFAYPIKVSKVQQHNITRPFWLSLYGQINTETLSKISYFMLKKESPIQIWM